MTPESLENRVTFPDVIAAIAEQTGNQQTGMQWMESDFLPLPCAHPMHSLAYAYREGTSAISLRD